MVVPVTNILEKDFNPEETKDLNLSLLIGPDRLSYLIIDPNSKKVLAIAAYSLASKNNHRAFVKNIEGLFHTDNLLSKPYANTSISLYTRRFTIIPNAFFEESDAKELFEALMHLDDKDHLQISSVQKIDSTIIYSINDHLHEWLRSTFPEAKQHCAAGPIIQNTLDQFANDEFVVLALLQAGSICLTISHKKQLLLHQIYGFQNAEDCLYFVLLAYKTLGLSTEKHPLLLSGELIQDSEIYKLLYQYIRHISFGTRPEGINYGPEVLRLPEHFHFDLFSIAVANR